MKLRDWSIDTINYEQIIHLIEAKKSLWRVAS